VPPDVILAAGMTATVEIDDRGAQQNDTKLPNRSASIKTARVHRLFYERRGATQMSKLLIASEKAVFAAASARRAI
jgi:hypothetical protein